MMGMYAAITLSVGNKAKTYDDNGNLLVVEAHYMMQYLWTMSQIQPNGGHDGYTYGTDLDALRESLTERGVSIDDDRWLPVEAPFPKE
jgi:hypothetical protein